MACRSSSGACAIRGAFYRPSPSCRSAMQNARRPFAHRWTRPPRHVLTWFFVFARDESRCNRPLLFARCVRRLLAPDPDLPPDMNCASRCSSPFVFVMPSMDTGVGGLPLRPAIGHCGRWPVLQRTAVHPEPHHGDMRCGSAARRPAWRPACRRPRRRRRGRRGRAGRSEKPGFFLAPASRPLFFSPYSCIIDPSADAQSPSQVQV